MIEPIEFYRYEVWRIGEDYGMDKFELRLRTFKAIRETNLGFWIKEGQFGKERWISIKLTKKKFARETKEKALECFINRTKRRVMFLKSDIEMCEYGLSKAEGMLNSNNT